MAEQRSPQTERILSAELVGWRDRRGRFGRLTVFARHALRELIDEQLSVMQALAVRESPDGGFRLVPGDREGRTYRPLPRFKDRWVVHSSVSRTGASGWLGNTAQHAPFVLFPTRPHTIAPRRRKALRYLRGVAPAGGAGVGNIVFSRRAVRHPGTRGNNVVERVWQRHGDDVHRELARRAGKVREEIQDIFMRPGSGS